MRYVIAALDFVGGVTLLAGRVLKLIFTGGVNYSLLIQQMVFLGVNSIPISMLVLSFTGATFTYVLAEELAQRGAAQLVGGMLLIVLLREFIPMLTGVVLAGKIGASITSEIGSMKITEQLDALKALSTDPHWYLTAPRVLAGMLMMPVIAVFSGYGGWFIGYYTANAKVGMTYATFTSGIEMLVDGQDYAICFIKCIVFSVVIVMTSCFVGFRTEGGAAGVGRAVTNSVVINIVLLFACDLMLTAILP